MTVETDADLLEDLESSMSSCVASELREFIYDGLEAEACNLIQGEGFNEQEARRLYLHLQHFLISSSVELRELTREEIESTPAERIYLVKRGHEILKAYLFEAPEAGGKVVRYFNLSNSRVPTAKIQQVWMIEEKQ